MMSITNLPNISVAEIAEIEQMQSLLMDSIDCLEQIMRARELTNIVWDINANGNNTESSWRKTEILLESYETARDEALELALSNLRELRERMDIETETNISTLPNLSAKNSDLSIGMSA